jgi:glycosyltransferase involved in cell wall biosynthesis
VRERICFVVSSELTVRAFLIPQLTVLGRSCDVTVVANTDTPDFLAELGVPAAVRPVGIVRPIAPWADIRALAELLRLFRRGRFRVVHSVSPKAALLAMVAARVAGVPIRIHTFTGQVWATARGWRRQLLKTMDRLIAACATHLLVDSHSQREFLLAEGVIPAARSTVLADGSISGVDATRFRPSPDARRETRTVLRIAADATVCLYLGRLNRDKGVLDLVRAFNLASRRCRGLHLVIVGPDEGGFTEAITAAAGDAFDYLRIVPYTAVPEEYMAAADIFCLPSYREGFGTVVIEAAATGVPAVASRIYGLTDAVEDGRTGLLHEAGDVHGIARCIERLVADPEERARMGAYARERARTRFAQERITAAVCDYYERLMAGQ